MSNFSYLCSRKPARLQTATMAKSAIFMKGVRDGVPIALGYFAVAFSLGIIARKASLTPLTGFVSSLLIRASAGEYGVYSSIAAGTTVLEIALISLVTNLRYLLMSASLTQKFAPGTGLFHRTMVACCMTDEIFGISIAYNGYLAPSYTYGAMTLSGVFWAAGTASGIIAGNALPASIVGALSVALYGMFIAIIIPPAKTNRTVLAAVFVSFLLSWICAVVPLIRTINSGTRTILLTIIISAVLSWLKPAEFTQSDESDVNEDLP